MIRQVAISVLVVAGCFRSGPEPLRVPFNGGRIASLEHGVLRGTAEQHARFALDDCTMQLRWKGAAVGQATPQRPTAIRIDGEWTVAKWDVAAPIASSDGLLFFDGRVACSSFASEVTFDPPYAFMGDPAHYLCAMTRPTTTSAPVVRVAADATVVSLTLRPGFFARVRDHDLVDPCSDRKLLDLASLGLTLEAGYPTGSYSFAEMKLANGIVMGSALGPLPAFERGLTFRLVGPIDARLGDALREMPGLEEATAYHAEQGHLL